MSSGLEPLPAGFAVGHWTDDVGRTGCTAILAPADGAACAGIVLGGGPGTRETDVLDPRSNADRVAAVVFAGGSAHGLAAADGAVHWLAERGRGYATPEGRIPIVPAAVVYDLAEGDASARPDAQAGAAACDAAHGDIPDRGRVGAGTGVAAGKALGRERATPTGIGYASRALGDGTVSVIAVANPVGDILSADGSVLAGPNPAEGSTMRSAELIASDGLSPPSERESTTLACVCTDLGLTKLGAAIVGRMAGAGIARAVEPVFTPFDGDAVFVLAAPALSDHPGRTTQLGTLAAALVAEAVRDAARSA